jgi:uncharacterized protein YjiK
MSRYRVGLALLAVAALTSACKRRGELSEAEAAEVASREQRVAARLASSADTTGAAILARWVLPVELKEISGLAVTANGSVLAHNDEQGRVFVIDPKKGVVSKQFMVGNGDLRGDFEAIAIRGSEIFMLVSNGTIYRFREGAEGQPVPYTTLDTKLGRECEFEGIAVDASRGTVLLPCKNVAKRGPKDALVIYRWDLAGSASQQPSMLTIPLPQLVGPNGWKSLHPSDMTIDPATGNYVIIAAQEKALVVITPDGQVVSAGPLPEPSEQAEGVAILREGVLIISDEGNRNPATITLYRWPLPISAASLSLTTTIPEESDTTLPAASR